MATCHGGKLLRNGREHFTTAKSIGETAAGNSPRLMISAEQEEEIRHGEQPLPKLKQTIRHGEQSFQKKYNP